jgi:TolB protein
MKALWGRMASRGGLLTRPFLRHAWRFGRWGVGLAAFVLACYAAVGVFERDADVGDTPKTGTADFNGDTGNYRVTGGGANIWAKADAFHFAWRQISGDVVVTADVKFIGTGAVDHRKAVLMIRQNLDRDAAYADVALHGDGLTSLQFRPTAGAETAEQRSTLNMPSRIRIARLGNQFTMYAGKESEELVPTGPATVVLQDPVLVGIGVCSHEANTLETAVFSNVRIETISSSGKLP